MPSRPVGITDAAPGTAIAEVDLVERASPDIITTTTADPGTAGTTLAVTNGGATSRFPQTNNFKVRVENEVMLVTAGAGTNSWTVTRAQDGTAAAAHAIGVTVAQVVGVQRVEPIDGSRQITFRGRASTFRTPGRAGTTGQKIFALHNSTSSTVLVNLHKITIDLAMTVVKAITVLPPIIRVHRFTAVPTNGTALAKVAEDTALTSNAQVTAWGDASADGTSSASALAITIPANNILTQEYAPRFITAAGYEPTDRVEFFSSENEEVILRPLQGVAVELAYTLATQNPTTDMWIVDARWDEYTVA